MSANRELDYALNFDAIAVAKDLSKVLNLHGKDAGMLTLAIAMDASKRRSDLLSERNDTNYRLNFSGTVELLEENGFELCVTIPFVDPDGVHEEQRIYWHPELLTLLTMESYQGESLNSGTMYFCWKPNKPNASTPERASGTWKGYTTNNPCFQGSIDIREGLFYNIQKMKDQGSFVKWY